MDKIAQAIRAREEAERKEQQLQELIRKVDALAAQVAELLEKVNALPSFAEGKPGAGGKPAKAVPAKQAE